MPRPPSCTTLLSGSTNSRPVTWLEVTPQASVCGPPEFSETLPPMVQDFWLEGSGAKYNPYFSAARERSRFTTPGDRKSTRLNSSHSQISYAVFCLKKKKKEMKATARRD